MPNRERILDVALKLFNDSPWPGRDPSRALGGGAAARLRRVPVSHRGVCNRWRDRDFGGRCGHRSPGRPVLAHQRVLAAEPGDQWSARRRQPAGPRRRPNAAGSQSEHRPGSAAREESPMNPLCIKRDRRTNFGRNPAAVGLRNRPPARSRRCARYVIWRRRPVCTRGSNSRLRTTPRSNFARSVGPASYGLRCQTRDEVSTSGCSVKACSELRRVGSPGLPGGRPGVPVCAVSERLHRGGLLVRKSS